MLRHVADADMMQDTSPYFTHMNEATREETTRAVCQCCQRMAMSNKTLDTTAQDTGLTASSCVLSSPTSDPECHNRTVQQRSAQCSANNISR